MNYRLAKVGLLRKYKPIYSADEQIVVGTSVKLIFELTSRDAEVNAERLWVDVLEISANGKMFKGKIDNVPQFVNLKYTDIIEFSIHNVFDIDNSPVSRF